jgi:hypothetical protein
MKNSKRLGATVLLILSLSLSALGGEILTPPCAAGEILTPPCASAPGDMSTPGVDSTSPGDLGSGASSEFSFADFAADLLVNFLPLY